MVGLLMTSYGFSVMVFALKKSIFDEGWEFPLPVSVSISLRIQLGIMVLYLSGSSRISSKIHDHTNPGELAGFLAPGIISLLQMGFMLK